MSVMATSSEHEISQGYGEDEEKLECCCNFHTALAAIFDLLDSEKRAAEDREKRLMYRVSELSRTVAELRTTVEVLSTAEEKEGLGATISAKKTKKKVPKAAKKPAPAGAVAQTVVQTAQCAASTRGDDDAPAQSSRSHAQPASDDAMPTPTSHEERSNSNPASLAPPSLSRFEDMPDEDDASWKLVLSTKPQVKKSVLFVGKLEAQQTEEKLKLFVERRAAEVEHPVKVFESKIFRKEETISARLVVDADSAKLIKHKKFWPKPMYCRDWKFDN